MDDLISISVVVPVYNSELFLKECIQSILGQSYKNIELLLIDDGSTDSSASICDDFVKLDSRVRYFKSKHCGVSDARNIGLDKSVGKYICFVDSDDLLESDYIEKMHKEISEKCVDVVFCNYQYLYGNKRLQRKPRIKPGKYAFSDIAHIAVDDGTISGILFGSVCTAIYDSNVIKKNGIRFDTSVKRNEDGLFNLCLLQKTTLFSVIEYNGYLYRQWKKNKSRSLAIDTEKDKATKRIEECCNKISNLDKQLRRRRLSIILWNSMSLANSRANVVKTCSAIREYLKENPIGDLYRDLDKLSFYKKILIEMLRKRHFFMFVFSIRYLYPILGRIIKR